MTVDTLQDSIEEAIPMLLKMAGEVTRNEISDKCKFILSEIKDSDKNFHIQRVLNKKENDKKIPVTLDELMPALKTLYHNFYDINLHIYKATEDLTVIDFRYYPRSSLDKDYQLKVLNQPPMLHCKIANPPWLSDTKQKFDINWEHNGWLNKLRLFWMGLKLKTKKSTNKVPSYL